MSVAGLILRAATSTDVKGWPTDLSSPENKKAFEEMCKDTTRDLTLPRQFTFSRFSCAIPPSIFTDYENESDPISPVEIGKKKKQTK